MKPTSPFGEADAADERALPDEDYRFTLGISRGSIAEFFAPSPEHDALLRERRDWLTRDPDLYAGLLPDGVAAVHELCELANDWVSPDGFAITDHGNPLEKLLALSQRLEPDLVLVQPNEFTVPISVGGCVCFPSSWSLPEKLGLSVSEIHKVVPGLNAVLATRIDKLLAALKPGEGWIRSNWGATAVDEWNQHPERGLPEITLPIDPERGWLRREHQILFRLPRTSCLVFGIRLDHTLLARLLDQRELAQRWARGLQSMPLEMLKYKRLDRVREGLVQALTRH